MRSRREKTEENLETKQKAVEDAAGKVAQQHRNERKIAKRTPDNVRIREEAAARCTTVIKRKALKKQARKARAVNTWLSAVWQQEIEKFKENH